MKDNSRYSKMLRVFVYGTLKRGEVLHPEDLVCGIVPAEIKGDIFGRVGEGYPYVVLAPDQVLSIGTRDYGLDRDNQSNPEPHLVKAAWDRGGNENQGLVHGQVLYFRYPDTLAGLDRIEGYVPSRSYQHYHRSLVPVRIKGELTTAWVYHVDEAPHSLPRIPTGKWWGRVRC